MIAGSFFLIALVDLWVHGEEDAKAKLHMQEMYWGNREWEMFLGIGGESHQTIPGTSWNHDAMIFPVTLLDLSFKNNFLYTQYLIWCCHRGNVSLLSKKQTHHWIIITPITYVVPLALMKGERKERLNRKRLQTQDGGLRNLSRLMRISDLLEPWEGSHIRINWPEPVSLTGSAWGRHGVSLHGGWACVTCQSSPLPAGGAAGERLEQRHSMATKVHPWWYTDPLLTNSQAPILLGANSDPVSQSPCDVRMVPFPQCTFSLSTTIGPFGEDWRDYHKTVLLQHHKVFPARDSATSLFHGLRTWSWAGDHDLLLTRLPPSPAQSFLIFLIVPLLWTIPAPGSPPLLPVSSLANRGKSSLNVLVKVSTSLSCFDVSYNLLGGMWFRVCLVL